MSVTNRNEGSSDRTRLSLELSSDLNRELERVASETGRSKADLLRLAAGFLLSAQKAQAEGMHVGAWGEDQKTGVRREREFVGF